jgi:LEA14-like dessication related protein
MMVVDAKPRCAIRRTWALAALLLVSGCSLLAPKFEKPEVSVAGIQMVGGNFLQQNFLVKLNIQNPNDRALPVTSLHVELNVGGERIASGVNAHAFVVPAHGDTQFDMNITANMALALLKLAGRKDQQADSIDYDMTGGASLDLPFLRDLPFHQNGTFSLRLPQ